MAEVLHKASVAERAARVAEPLVRAEGFELVDVEYLREPGGWILRLYIDKPERPPLAREGGVGLEECARVSHAVETALDVEDVVASAYSLEVSSPGVNRPLRKPEHFQRVLGKRVKVKTYGPLGTPGRKSFTGTLEGVADDGVTVHVEGGSAFHIPFRDIAKANLEFDF
jgi:ribosome maturation factor RimP